MLAVGRWANLQVWETVGSQGRRVAYEVCAAEIEKLLAMGRPWWLTEGGWEHLKVTLDKMRDRVV